MGQDATSAFAAAGHSPYGATPGPDAPGWAGLAAFASSMLAIVGGFHVISGLNALVSDEVPGDPGDYLFRFDATSWGWVHLVLGVLLILAAAALFSGALWARIVGATAAGLTALAAFAWLPWYPVAGILLVVLSVFVILALTVHGRDLARSRSLDYTP